MHIENWDDIRFFLAVARTGSLVRAADTLAVNHTTVSRRVGAMEKRLGSRLFERLPGGWALTNVGAEILSTAERMDEHAATLGRRAASRDHELSGLLRVTTEESILRCFLMPELRAFSEAHPAIRIELVVSDLPLDLTRREADIAFRCTDDPPPNLVGRRVAEIAYAIYGTKELAERCRKSRSGSAVPAITWIGDGTTAPQWVQRSFPKADLRYRVDSLAAMQNAAREGLGIAQLPCTIGDLDERLWRIPAKFVEPGWGLWVLSHVDLRTTVRVRVFREHMIAKLSANKDLIEGRRPRIPPKPKRATPRRPSRSARRP